MRAVTLSKPGIYQQSVKIIRQSQNIAGFGQQSINLMLNHIRYRANIRSYHRNTKRHLALPDRTALILSADRTHPSNNNQSFSMVHLPNTETLAGNGESGTHPTIVSVASGCFIFIFQKYVIPTALTTPICADKQYAFTFSSNRIHTLQSHQDRILRPRTNTTGSNPVFLNKRAGNIRAHG